MPNLRIIYDNAADRATLTASSQAGSLSATNLLTDIKSDIYRSSNAANGIAASATIYATWNNPETIAGVVIPFCNLSSLATMRVQIYALVSDSTPIFDSGAILACPAPALGLWGWGSSLGANAFAFSDSSYGRLWLSTVVAGKKMTLDIVDPNNLGGYIEISRLVCGSYFSPAYNPDMGAGVTMVDNSKQFRNDAGDLLTDNGTRHRKQTLNLSQMPPSDRSSLWNIMNGNGITRPMLLSFFPNSEDSQLEQTYQMYCKLVSNPMLTTPYFNRFNASLEIEEV